MKIERRRIGPLRAGIIGALIIVIVLITLTPSGASRSAFSFALGFARRGLADGILNFFLFVPLGVALGWKSPSLRTPALVGIGLATAIELAQMFVPGRDPALTDIIFNGAGALVGALLGRHPRTLVDPDHRRSMLLTTASLVAVALLMVGTAILLSPLPQVPHATATAIRMPASASASPNEMATLFSSNVVGASERLLLARSGNDLVLHFPSKAGAAGLDEPEYWKRGLLAGVAAGESSTVAFMRDGARWDITLAGKRTTLGPSVGFGWAMLGYPDAFARQWAGVISAAWMFAIWAVVGYWARGWMRAMALVAVVVLLAVVPQLIGAEVTSRNEWIGALAGLVAGTGIALLVHRMLRRVLPGF